MGNQEYNPMPKRSEKGYVDFYDMFNQYRKETLNRTQIAE